MGEKIMKKRRIAKDLIESIIGYAGFSLIWTNMSDRQKKIFLEEMLIIPDVARAVSIIGECDPVDEEEDTEG